ncbi:MAG TPA: hypothetical protein VKW06_10405 [Candidatus Angelobacter sp.]|nr:hypothetical protein [Candidatus Angelobacter sp.]
MSDIWENMVDRVHRLIDPERKRQVDAAIVKKRKQREERARLKIQARWKQAKERGQNKV